LLRIRGQGRHAAIGGAVALLVATMGMTAVLANPNGVPQHQPDTQKTASFGFATFLSDSEVRDLLTTYKLEGHAVFTWSSGLTGVHRVYGVEVAALALTGGIAQDARAASESFFASALAGNERRLKTFLETHSAEGPGTDAKLEIQLRSLLNIRYRLERALAHVRAGEPLIYGVEVAGSPESIDAARRDQRVDHARVPEHGNDENARVPTPDKPHEADRRIDDPELASMSGRDLHERAEREMAQ